MSEPSKSVQRVVAHTAADIPLAAATRQSELFYDGTFSQVAHNRRNLRLALDEIIRPFGFRSIEELAAIEEDRDPPLGGDAISLSVIDVHFSPQGSFSSTKRLSQACQGCRKYEAILRSIAKLLCKELSETRAEADCVIAGSEHGGIFELLSTPKGHSTSVVSHSEGARRVQATAEPPCFPSMMPFMSVNSSMISLSDSNQGSIGSASWFREVMDPEPQSPLEGARPSVSSIKRQPYASSLSGGRRRRKRRISSNISEASSVASRLPSPRRITTYVARGLSYSTMTVPNVEVIPHVKETQKTVFGRFKDKRTINEYVVVKPLSCGAFSHVDLVQHRETKEYFAMKAIKVGNIQKKSKRASSIRCEVAVFKRVIHPNLLRLYEVIGDKSHNTVYLILEYIPGGAIGRSIAPGIIEPIPEDTLRGYARQLLSVLKALHTYGICHRDIKPDNILIGDSGKVYLSDFGVSAIITDSGVTGVEGTPAYMAPEVCSGSSVVVGELVDIWALGVTLYQLMYGFLPFRSRTFVGSTHKISNVPVFFPDERSDINFSVNLGKFIVEGTEEFSSHFGDYESQKRTSDTLRSGSINNTHSNIDSNCSPCNSSAFRRWKGNLCKNPLHEDLGSVVLGSQNSEGSDATYLDWGEDEDDNDDRELTDETWEDSDVDNEPPVLNVEVQSSPEFKDLIRGMLEKDPSKRWTLRRVLHSTWLASAATNPQWPSTPVVPTPPPPPKSTTPNPSAARCPPMPILCIATSRPARDDGAVSFLDAESPKATANAVAPPHTLPPRPPITRCPPLPQRHLGATISGVENERREPVFHSRRESAVMTVPEGHRQSWKELILPSVWRKKRKPKT